jgi:ectoine hydroxylase-related dioxygenase (phytanoyl-CoA dioxygenase family)
MDIIAQVVRAALEPYYLPYNKQIPSMPATLVSGQFLATPHDDARLTLLHNGAKDKIYVTIALSTCIRATGMYSLLKRSHHDKNPRTTPVNDWEREDVALNPGDALIWRGDVSYLVNPGGGGKWV